MKIKRLTAQIMTPIIISCMLSLSGCGADNNQYEYEEADNEAYDENYDDYQYADVLTEEETYSYDEDPIQLMLSRPVTYATENTLSQLEAIDHAIVPVTIDNFCDYFAVEYGNEKNCNDHLLWLSDYVVNSVEPQAVEMLLQIPVLRKAAENGEISKYISVYLTYNDVNSFGAMEESCYLGRDGHGVEEWDSPFYYIGHRVLVNLVSFPLDVRDRPSDLQFIESAMIHEMMHGFMTDYLFNLSLGTGKDGARLFNRDANGKIIMDEDERPVHIDEIPSWFQEGLAMVVENPYGTRRTELQDYFDTFATDEEYLEMLSSPESVYNCINPDFEELGIVNTAKISDEGNTYTTGWIATLFLCSQAGEKLGYTAFDENGYFNPECAFYGLNEIITSIHDGHSLDYVIADISPAYKDTSDFEGKCFGSVDDPGLIFMQKLLFDFEARCKQTPDNYIPSGSVLPGYVNGAQSCMDDFYHNTSSVYEVDNIDESNPLGDYFSLSTIRMSKVALGGGRSTSYDPLLFPLTDKEQAERDHGYIGNEKKYIDLSLEDD